MEATAARTVEQKARQDRALALREQVTGRKAAEKAENLRIKAETDAVRAKAGKTIGKHTDVGSMRVPESQLKELIRLDQHYAADLPDKFRRSLAALNVPGRKAGTGANIPYKSLQDMKSELGARARDFKNMTADQRAAAQKLERQLGEMIIGSKPPRAAKELRQAYASYGTGTARPKPAPRTRPGAAVVPPRKSLVQTLRSGAAGALDTAKELSPVLRNTFLRSLFVPMAADEKED